MDEPFGALDPLTRAEMQDMFAAACGAKENCLLVTHDLDEALYLGTALCCSTKGAWLRILRQLSSCSPACRRLRLIGTPIIAANATERRRCGG